MYKKVKRVVNDPVPHPHFKQSVGDGFQILPDAPQIDPHLNRSMFSLSVNKLNGQNLQAVTIEESNRLNSVAETARVSSALDNSIKEYAKQQKEQADYEQYLKEKQEKTADNEKS